MSVSINSFPVSLIWMGRRMSRAGERKADRGLRMMTAGLTRLALLGRGKR